MPCGSCWEPRCPTNSLGRQAFRHWASQCAVRTQRPICPGRLGVPETRWHPWIRRPRIVVASRSPLIYCVKLGHRHPTMPSPHVQLWLPCDVPGGADPAGGPLFFIRTVIRYHAHVDEAIHASKTRGTALFKLICPPLLCSISMDPGPICSLAHLEPIACCISQT